MKHECTKTTFCMRPLAVALGLTLLSPFTLAADSVTSALTGGKVSLNARLRYESVSDDAVIKDADGLTLRTRLGYETAPFKGFSAVIEGEDTHTVLGVDNYAPENAGYATIADPEVTEVNRAYLRYRGISKLDLGYGRQRINYDNQRFIGGVAWRQDEQTFDGFTAVYTGVTDLTVNLAYLTQVNGIMGVFDSDNIEDSLINLSYGGFSFGKITAYAYLLDHSDEKDTSVNAGLRFDSSDTLGVRFEGAQPLPTQKPMKVLYVAEYANQDFESTTGAERDADYLFLEAGINAVLPSAVVTGKLSYEELGSDDGLYGFQTPYGTKHAFNGWADKFLVTPTSGLQDTFATLVVAFPAYAMNLVTAYHEYEADSGSGDFGSEWDIQLAKTFSPNYTVGIKYAAYEGEDAPYKDTNKFWLWGEFNF